MSSLDRQYFEQHPRQRPKVPAISSDWDEQRTRITQLYFTEDITLKCLQDIMESRYNFKATRRQYTRRIKDWQLHKNLKAAEKDVLLDSLRDVDLQSCQGASVMFNSRPVKVSVLIRYRAQKMKSASGKRKARMLRASTSACSEDSDSVSFEKENNANIESRESLRLVRNSPRKIPSVVPQLSLELVTHENQSLRYIINLSQRYFCHTIERFAQEKQTGATQDACQLPINAPHFWTEIKNAIYLLKKGHGNEAWPLISHACNSSLNQFSINVSTLTELFTTLSPINTSILPALRGQLLHYLGSLLGIRLGRNHPIPMVCMYLQQDTQPQISERALRFMVAFLQKSLGLGHIFVMNSRSSLIKLLRRQGALAEAEAVCAAHVACAAEYQGQYSVAARKAMRELVHIRTGAGRSECAKELGEEIVRGSNMVLGRDFPDEQALYAIEDLSELYEMEGNLSRAIELLEIAASNGNRVFGLNDGWTNHVCVKLGIVQMKRGNRCIVGL